MEALTEEVDRHANKNFAESSPKDAEMIAELEEEVKDKEKEIKRLGDGWSDSEEKRTGLRNMMSWKVKEIRELKESAQKTEQDPGRTWRQRREGRRQQKRRKRGWRRLWEKPKGLFSHLTRG